MNLGERMKENYEMRSQTKLLRRMPVIIRLDGKAFHTFTKGFDKPFDVNMSEAMIETMLYLCRNIQGCVLGYTQSDEITLVLVDYKELDSDAWYDYKVQKLCSVSASMATNAFNHFLAEFLSIVTEDTINSTPNTIYRAYCNYLEGYKIALFDSRCFNIPKEEVANCLVWRQQDATRNSISTLAQHYFSHKELQNLNSNQLQDKLMAEKNVNWNDLNTIYKRGCCCKRNNSGIWTTDREIPIFTQNFNYINDLINYE